jgi:o-succinylbenzoate synthase
MGQVINGVTAYIIRLPLIRPYHLSLGSLEAFDSILVRIQADGQEGFGEVTDCPGYYVQGLEDAWRFVRALAPELPGQDPVQALKKMFDEELSSSFAATPLLTALESLISSLERRYPGRARIPLLGIVQGETQAEIVAEIQEILENGYRTLKLKVGFSVMEDLERVRLVQSQLRPGIRVRIDANQGYDFAQARRFLEGLEPEGIELLEQPLKPGEWDGMTRLAAMTPVPLMLDEAIVGEEDLDRTIEKGCAQAVKFKLMKCGSFAHLERLIQKASEAGLKVILGNGVATDVGCLHEAELAAGLGLSVHAGEMNGFLKCTERLLHPKLEVKEGVLELPSESPSVLWERVSQLSVEEICWGEINTFD